jgi:hypothetical protein
LKNWNCSPSVILCDDNGIQEHAATASQNFVKKLIKGGLSKEADMFNNTEEHIWQFDVENGAHIKDNGRSHFESRANEMAAKIGCNLVGIKNVQLDFLRG